MSPDISLRKHAPTQATVRTQVVVGTWLTGSSCAGQRVCARKVSVTIRKDRREARGKTPTSSHDGTARGAPRGFERQWGVSSGTRRAGCLESAQAQPCHRHGWTPMSATPVARRPETSLRHHSSPPGSPTCSRDPTQGPLRRRRLHHLALCLTVLSSRFAFDPHTAGSRRQRLAGATGPSRRRRPTWSDH